MFGWLKKNSAASQVVGIDMSTDGCSLAVLEHSVAGQPRVAAVKRCLYSDSADPRAALVAAVRDLGIKAAHVVATLPHAAYSLVQLEAPDMPLDELREAMRWRVKDLIDFPVEQSVVDVFKLPHSQRPGAPELLYVVVAKSDEVDRVASLLTAAGLEIDAIDVIEMSIRNLALRVDQPGRPRAYLHLLPGETVIEIADGPQIYLTRRVVQHYDADSDETILAAQMENLALEVQRSLDYFESQYAFGPADRLAVIVCDGKLFEAFSDVAKTFLTVPVERFNFETLPLADGVQLQDLGRGITAVGAAMRGVA